MINSDIIKIANQACLKIFADDKIVDIKHKFRLGDKSILGILFFLCGGVFLIVVTVISSSDATSKILGIAIGLILFVLSILTLIRQVSDGLKIKDNIITIRHNLNRTTVPLNRSMKIRMETEVFKARGASATSTDFMIITLYLQDLNKETPVLRFQMDNAYAVNARKLGDELTRIINDKFRL